MKYPLATVLSISNGRLCCDIGDVYEILNFITGDNLFTHVLPRADKFARPLILNAYPELCIANTKEANDKLSDLILNSTPAEGVEEWLVWCMETGLAAEYEIESNADSWLSFDPVAEAQGMFPGNVTAVSKQDLIESDTQNKHHAQS